MREETFYVLTFDEFDKLVHDKLGWEDFECIEEFEWDRSSHSMRSIIATPDYSRYKPNIPKERIQDWYMRDLASVEARSAGPHQLLTWLCFYGHIPPGNYLVEDV